MCEENHAIQGSAVNSHTGCKLDLEIRTRQKDNFACLLRVMSYSSSGGVVETHGPCLELSYCVQQFLWSVTLCCLWKGR